MINPRPLKIKAIRKVINPVIKAVLKVYRVRLINPNIPTPTRHKLDKH